jgi:hypothetical protein
MVKIYRHYVFRYSSTVRTWHQTLSRSRYDLKGSDSCIFSADFHSCHFRILIIALLCVHVHAKVSMLISWKWFAPCLSIQCEERESKHDFAKHTIIPYLRPNHVSYLCLRLNCSRKYSTSPSTMPSKTYRVCLASPATWFYATVQQQNGPQWPKVSLSYRKF